MTRCDFHTPRQRCSDSSTILPSLHDNVAVLMYDAEKVLIFAIKKRQIRKGQQKRKIYGTMAKSAD